MILTNWFDREREASMRRRSIALLSATLLLTALSGLGCYDTPFLLGDVADARVDAKLLGTWQFDNLWGNEDESATLVVKDLDGKQYDVLWTPKGKDALKMTAFIVEVKGASFVHARGFEDDGKPADTTMLMRVDLDGDRIALSNLSDDYFETKTVNSNQSLRAAVEAGIEDPNFYDDELMVGTKLKT
jgi:hypothetical protein